MKNFMYALAASLCFINSYAQEKTRLEQSDIVFKNGSTVYMIEPVKISLEKKDGTLVNVPISLRFTDSIYKAVNMDTNKLNLMLFKGYLSAMYSCKNKYSFEPKEGHIFYSDKYKIWSVSFKFTAQNDYGAMKDGDYNAAFDVTGTNELSATEFIEVMDAAKQKPPKKETSEERRKRKRAEHDAANKD